MKNIIKYTSSAALGLALIGSANAATIYIAGATGQRLAGQTAIRHVLTNPTFSGTNSDSTKANFGIWEGTFKGQVITIKVAFGGSAGGIAAVAGGKTVKFVADATPTKDPTAAGAQFEAHIPDFTTSDNFQSTTTFNGSFQGTVYETLQDELVGVTPFRFLASKGFPGNNITTQQAQLLYLEGKVPLSMFTGKFSHQKKTVFAIGRNTDSGSRGTALSEIGLGSQAVIKQYLPTITGAKLDKNGVLVGGFAISQELTPIEEVSGVNSNTLGNSGYKSGSLVGAAMTVKLGPDAYKVGNDKATGGFYIGYIADADAINIALPSGAKDLAYNGVPYSLKAISEGQYTFWCYGHVLYKKNLGGVAKQFVTSFVAQVKDSDANAGGAGLFIKKLFVQRSSDGGAVTPLFF